MKKFDIVKSVAIIANLGVIVGLVFVALEVRHARIAIIEMVGSGGDANVSKQAFSEHLQLKLTHRYRFSQVVRTGADSKAPRIIGMARAAPYL